MHQAALPMSDVYTPTRYKLTIEDFHKLGDVGILSEDSRVELIEGELIEMPPIKGPHLWCVTNLTHLLVKAVGERALVSVQNPIALPPGSEPQPDCTVLRPDARGRRDLPLSDDILLVVEVADATLSYDRGVKQRLYARSGIGEFWVIDVKARRVECYRHPEGDGYGVQTVHEIGAALTIQALPGIAIPVVDIFA